MPATSHDSPSTASAPVNNLKPHGFQPMGPVSIGIAILTIALWGGTAVSNQIAFDVYPPFYVGGLRFGMAAIFMACWCRIEGTPLWLAGSQWSSSLLVGVLMFIQIATFNYGTALSNSSHAIVLVNSYVFWVAFYEGFIRRAVRFHWWQICGLLLAGGGVLLLVSNAENEVASKMDQPTIWGDVVLALSGFTLGVKSLVVKQAVKTVPPSSLILWHDIFGSGLLFLLSFVSESPTGKTPVLETYLALLFGGIAISGLCFVLNAILLQKHGASQVAVFSFATPITGILLAYLLRGDHLSRWLVLSGLFVATGIFLVNYQSSRRR